MFRQRRVEGFDPPVKFEMRECMRHQNLAKELGLPDARQFGKDEMGYFKSIGGRPATENRPAGYVLLYSGRTCPLCTPSAILDRQVTGPDDDYPWLRAKTWGDGSGN